MSTEHFGTLPGGERVDRITMRSADLSVAILTLGAAVQDLRLDGVDWPLTLGAPAIAPYLDELAYFGVVVGPVANRLRGGRVPIGDRVHQLPLTREGGYTLHSGPDATLTRVWNVETVREDRVVLSLRLDDGAQGLPGNRRITAEYTLGPACLDLRLEAESDATTPFNLANHSYWNLDGSDAIAGHRLRVGADRVLETDEDILPTGRLIPVAGSHLDLREDACFAPGPERRYDHSYIFAREPVPLRPLAVLTGRRGVEMTLASTEPALQVYDAGTVDSGRHPGHTGRPYRPFCAVALEAQRYPDAPNRPEFPSILLEPGARYVQHSRWSFRR